MLATCRLQLRSALRELRDSFTQLLRGRRAGVPAALLAAAARAGNAALQVDAAKALLTATAVLQTGTSGQVCSIEGYVFDIPLAEIWHAVQVSEADRSCKKMRLSLTASFATCKTR